ncbi:SdrD B-like domain-containing protein, partial [Clostridium sporogenes]|uniref:SdrD B-like domain-containing protein n=1 Tax=Clostridium sporogenes TaxID=1509 RepID=UPI003F8EFD14
MAATIRGTVFNDLNNNGVLDPGEPGIPNAYVVIRDPNGVCTTVQANLAGVYTFPNLTVAGNYTVYETAVDPGATCPPTTFGQPAGFTNSSTFRTQTINVT